MHYHLDMIIHDMAFVEPVGGTGGSKLVTRRQRVNSRSKQNGQNCVLSNLHNEVFSPRKTNGKENVLQKI